MSSLIVGIPRSRCRGLVVTALLGAVLVAGNWGCRGNGAAPVGCTPNMQCPTDSLCMMGTCVPRVMGRTVAVDILPRTDSSAARTGIAGLVLGPGQVALAADARVVVEGTVTNAPKAHVILLVPSPIPGQADLQFETDVAGFKFQLDVGSRLLHSMATIWLIPNVDAPKQPPVPFQTMLGASLSFTFPAASEMTVVRGILHDWWDMPPAPFMARALVDSKVVSNVAITDDFGRYELLIAPGAVPQDAGVKIVVDFTPMMPPDTGSRFQTVAIPLAAATAAQPRVFRMPASDEPASMRFLVQASDKGAQPISDVTVRFHAEIPSATDGVAIFEREARSDAFGEVTVSLVPGTAAEPLNYQVTIVPPPDSPYGTKCLPQLPVAIPADNGQSPQYSDIFSVEPKVTLQGTVRGNDLAPAATMSVMATPLSVTADCPSSLAASPVSTTTSRTGTFQMLVDPGTYRLEIDPPTGSPVPRLTEDGNAAVVVTDDPVTTHDVTLPAGEVVEGDVKGADNVPLGSASLKIYQVVCHTDTCKGPARMQPALQAQTRTDMSGHFRVVLPPLP
ncbi:MAG: hypothetical protein ABJA82_09680 [Myxococcales bacterium]